MSNIKKYKSLEKICRAYWNEFDPIGVTDTEIDDEYDSYLPQTVKLILAGADEYKFLKYIEHCVNINMGMSPTSDQAMRDFARKLAVYTTEMSEVKR